jgi:hypothetical protein
MPVKLYKLVGLPYVGAFLECRHVLCCVCPFLTVALPWQQWTKCLTEGPSAGLPVPSEPDAVRCAAVLPVVMLELGLVYWQDGGSVRVAVKQL